MNTLYLLCQEVNNWFDDQREIGHFKITNGVIPLALEGYKYIRIIGSNENDGIYETANMELTDEEFDGAVWYLKIPKPFRELAESVDTWLTANAGKEMYQSESFGGYSYTRNPNSMTWQWVFKSQLDAWRKKR